MGVLTVGPQGLLDVLETQLGLASLRPCEAERTASYRESLARLDNPQRFYHASFSADELGVAQALLGWRDELYLHGWQGHVKPESGQRLRDLAEVETTAHEVVAPSIGQRLAAVASALAVRRPPIQAVLLVDEWEVYPTSWQRVLSRLPHSHLERPLGNAEGFLGLLQAQLRKSIAGEAAPPIPWEDDGSVKVIQAQTHVLAATWLSRSLAADTQTMLVAGSKGGRLDSHLAGAGGVRHGLNEHSDLRPALQLLPLALELLWAPLNYPALLQFLTHPICPIQQFARRALASKIATKPGIVGAAWDDTMAQIAEHYGDDASRVRLSIRDWLEAPAFRVDDGAPVGEILERVERLLVFFKSRLAHEQLAQSHAARAGYAQCEAAQQTLQILQVQGMESLRPRQLQQVIEQATSSGTVNPLIAAEVGAHLTVSQPGAVIEHADTVVWWNLGMPSMPANSPWSKAERKQLLDMGVALPEGAALLTEAAHNWLRPVFAASRQLILVLAPPHEESHPLWQMIETVVHRPRVQALEDLLLTTSSLVEPHLMMPLPARKRWWKLPPNLPMALPEKASYSSLNLLLFNPYQWLLHHAAQIRASKSLSLNDSFLLNGSLAHSLAEQFFSRKDALTMSTAEFEIWFSEDFDRVVREEGAVLLMEGRGADLTSLRHRVRRALNQLRAHLATAGAVSVTSEYLLDGQFAGGALAGSADLIITTALGHRAIIDMKWAGGKKYPEQLRANRHLQLAIYAELLRQQTGSPPSVAYFILAQARLLTPDDRVFTDAERVPANPPSSTPELWLSFTETWKWRQEQTTAGLFEVALEGIDEDEDSTPPENAMRMEYLKEAYNDYMALAGWEQ
jgi:hypothetical protein